MSVSTTRSHLTIQGGPPRGSVMDSKPGTLQKIHFGEKTDGTNLKDFIKYMTSMVHKRSVRVQSPESRDSDTDKVEI